jgi:hypothetical protein
MLGGFMICALLKEITNHDSIVEIYRKNFVHCDLMSTKGSLNTMGVLCCGCCLKISQIIDILKDSLTSGVFTDKELAKNPALLYDRLPDRLKEYAIVVARITGKDWNDIAFIHSRCRADSFETLPSRPEKPIEITCLRKNAFS